MVEIVPAGNGGRGDPGGEEADGGISVERREKHSAVCKWLIPSFSKLKQRTTRCLWSKYFEVGGYDCRLLVYPAGDSQALPGYISIYLQVTDPKNATGKWDCFASYRLCVANQADDSKSIARDSWHRFSAKRKSHGWCDFAQSSAVLDPSSGFAVNDTILVTADIMVLSEHTQFAKDHEMALSSSSSSTEVLSGKFTWKVKNFGLFREMIKTQKIMSPAFAAGDCSLRLSVYQSAVNGSDFLSMCLESKDTDKSGSTDRSCWCLFRMSVLSQQPGGRHMHRDSYGRFAADSKTGDNTSLGWNDFMSVAAFTEPSAGYFVDDTATFSASFHIIKESCAFNRSIDRGVATKSRSRLKGGTGDAYQGKFTWKIEHFTRLKELLKKRKITGLCIKSRRFQVGSRDCRLIVYPRGQSQPPNHLSMFLEVTDPSANNADWSCFVSHRLSVVNQRSEDKSVAKESQNRYSKQAKDWGWREFVTLTSLFDLDAGFLVNDCVVFAAEVLVLRETSELKALPSSKRQLLLEMKGSSAALPAEDARPKLRFSWRVENFVAFKEIMETRKIFSKYFTVEGCDLRIGVYESFDTLCIYLESDAFGSGLERNFWVKYRIAIVNQKFPERTEWKESSICTKTWNNSVLQFMKVTEMVDQEAGYLQRDGLLLACEVLDCQPWFDFADLEVLASDSEAESMSTDPDELLDSDDSDMLTAEEEDTFRSLLGDAGLHLVESEGQAGMDARDLQQVLSDKMEMDMEAAVSFIAGLRLYLADDAFKIKRLLQSANPSSGGSESGACLFDLLMGIEVLQQPLLDLLLDTLAQLCHQQPRVRAVGGKLRRQAYPGSPDPAASLAAAAYSRFSLDGREDGECASSSAALPVSDSIASKPSMPPVLPGHESGSSGTTTPQEAAASIEASPESRPPNLQDSLATIGSEDATGNAVRSCTRAAATSGREKADELIMVALRWLSSIESFCPQTPEARARLPSAAVSKVQSLLTDLPRQLQPQLVFMVPNLIDSSQHTAAAGVLLARLAEANREGPHAERELRLPVLSALGCLHIDPAIAERVLHTALEALSSLSETELPPAVGLALKLASETESSRPAAIHAVRMRIRAQRDTANGTLDAVRLAMSQHSEVAAAMLADIDSECRTPKSASPMEGESREAAGESPAQLHAADVEMLLDLLANPSLAEKARTVFERAIARGFVIDMEVAATLEQRRMRNLASNVKVEAEEFLSSLESATAAALRADALAMPARGGLPHEYPAVDDSEAVLGLAEVLAVSKNQKARSFAASLYQTLFRVNTEETKRGRMLRGLVSRAAAGSALQQANAKDRSTSAAPLNSRPTPINGRSSHLRSPRQSLGGSRDVGPAEPRQELDVTTPEGLLLSLISQQAGAARPAVLLMMLEAQASSAKAAGLSKRVQELESGQDRALKEAKSAAQKNKQEALRLAERLSDTESQVAQLRGDHTAQASAFADTKRELEEKVRNLERELEWVRGEREEERIAMAHERREKAAQLKELEASSNRLKSARRDDLKRVTRERTQAVERSKELEASHSRLEEEVRRLRGVLATSTATQDSLATQMEEQERKAAEALSRREEQVGENESRIKELEASLKERTTYVSGLEAQLREEIMRSAPLYGSNLDRMSAAQLENLARIHERGLKQARSLMVQRRSEESAAATAVAAANAVTGGPPPRPVQSRSSPGSAASVPQRSASSVGSLDSLRSLGLDPPLSSGMRGLAPAHRAPGAVQLSSAASIDHPSLDFGGHQGVAGLQRSMTPGLASYYTNANSSQPGVFSQANAALPNGFPNGLLSGTGLLNGKQSSGNGIHRLW